MVADPVQVDSICLLGCRFWNYSKFLRKRPADWHVAVQYGHVGAVAVVESIETPWQDYGRSAESDQNATKSNTQTRFFGVLSLAPATQWNESLVSASRIELRLF